MMSGYVHPQYAASLAEFGTPHELAHCGGWILRRPIITTGQSSDVDALGCYPLFACRDWQQLHIDLKEIDETFVSVSLVTDPFGNYDEEDLRGCFPHVMFPFKQHLVADLSVPINRIVSKHHRYYARKAAQSITVEVCQTPLEFLDEWHSLYKTLIQKHNIKGMRAFSREAFAVQLTVPGIVMFRATHEGAIVSAHLWYRQGDTAYSHLAASSTSGYEQMASYALYWFALEYFAGKGTRWLDYGAGAGTAEDERGGLNFFKRGWSNETRTVYFCGRIFNESKYNELVSGSRTPETNYFPAYRSGEFSGA